MIKPKAPMDMTAPEFVEYFKEKKQVPSYGCNIRDIYNDMVKMLSEPAQNPFTDDQIATMREYQRGGWNYAAKGVNGVTKIFKYAPEKLSTYWKDGHTLALPVCDTFLDRVADWNDPEPICFADYAPLEEK